MTITDIAAWYAAAVATAVFVWDIVKWSRNGPRLRINTTCNIAYPDGRVIAKRRLEGGGESTELATYCHVEVLNVGGQPTTIIDIQLANLPPVGGMQLSHSWSAFTLHNGSHPLPAVLGPGEVWSARVEMDRLESISKHGTVVLRTRTSHDSKAIQTAIDFESDLSQRK